MKKILFFACLLASFHLFAQKDVKKWDIRLGAGVSLLGNGDIPTTTVEYELNYQLNPYFTTSASLKYGNAMNEEEYGMAVYRQGNINLFLSPFKNTVKNDFRIGTGISFYKVSEAHYGLFTSTDGLLWQPVVSTMRFYTRHSLGYNLIIENTYTIKNKILIGAKAFIQPYNNGDMNAGILLKLGVKI